MSRAADETKANGISREDNGAVVVGFTEILPGKAGKSSGITLVRVNNYAFNTDAMTSFKGDTGPYPQYAYAPLCSIKRRAALSDEELGLADPSLLTEAHAVNVVRMLAEWPDVLQNTLKTLEPTTVLTLLFKMARVVSSSYDHLQVVIFGSWAASGG
ncbi:Heat-labile enterotoxin, A chain [Tolypocladium paradoxum]|uniref:arginine--tRNA ligase n=1 Tax=Tolypocladium paradoxum TaxID=94208 RepID=A0A2S4KYV4_9HYPO|nr:Heat-labile enterotoxin, A chain [Tolypocladium paradoxum]